MWSFARKRLHLSSDEFYELTPRQLDALVRQHERAIQEEEFLFGQLASLFVNFSMSHPKEPVSAKDFMPSEWAKRASRPSRRRPINRDLVVAQIKGMMEGLMKRGRDG